MRVTGVGCWSADRVFKYDLSLAPGEMYALVDETRRRLADFPDSKVLVTLLCIKELLSVVDKNVRILSDLHACVARLSSLSSSGCSQHSHD